MYHKPSSKGGRPPIPLEVMLIDTPCFRRFAGIETMEEPRIAEQILEGVNQMLSERGVIL